MGVQIQHGDTLNGTKSHRGWHQLPLLPVPERGMKMGGTYDTSS